MNLANTLVERRGNNWRQRRQNLLPKEVFVLRRRVAIGIAE
jgi:hypothetical protein